MSSEPCSRARRWQCNWEHCTSVKSSSLDSNLKRFCKTPLSRIAKKLPFLLRDMISPCCGRLSFLRYPPAKLLRTSCICSRKEHLWRLTSRFCSLGWCDLKLMRPLDTPRRVASMTNLVIRYRLKATSQGSVKKAKLESQSPCWVDSIRLLAIHLAQDGFAELRKPYDASKLRPEVVSSHGNSFRLRLPRPKQK